MTYHLTVRPKAEIHLAKAYKWYEEKLTGLGDEFLLAVDACINVITRSPLLFQKRHKEIRAALTDRFPYGIYYFVDSDKK